MGNAILEYRPQRRAARLLFVERTIRRFSPATLPAEPYSSGRYRQHKACRNKNQAKNARGQSCPPAQISIALLPLPAVSFVGGFQTPAGPEKTRAHPSGRHLKPITRADSGPILGHSRYTFSCGISRPKSPQCGLCDLSGTPSTVWHTLDVREVNDRLVELNDNGLEER